MEILKNSLLMFLSIDTVKNESFFISAGILTITFLLVLIIALLIVVDDKQTRSIEKLFFIGAVFISIALTFVCFLLIYEATLVIGYIALALCAAGLAWINLGRL